VWVSSVHLAATLTGMGTAMSRRSPFDVPFLHGDPNRMGPQSIVFGTALSEPIVMLIAETGGLALLVLRDSHAARILLRALGASNIVGYLLERHVRYRLRCNGWDALESPLILTGIAASAMMVVLSRDEIRSSSQIIENSGRSEP
jgi:hypothetical protein